MGLVSYFMYFIGIVSVLDNRQDLVRVIISVELMFASMLLRLVVSSLELDDSNGLVFCLLVLGVAACESAIGLAMTDILMSNTYTQT